ncbi:ImmA/IrrE family metallo-endopeptidase [Bacillus sp. JJ1566]|uniref:ImmA/IrrE family metallo-endopeptidase n=1 Tax=Bacillus sp. JJ1566 TaxID=3122961 RepID=UPI002FFE1FF1
MQVRELTVKTDYWEDRANKILSHFNYKSPDEIDLYDICWKYGIKIKPLDKDFYDGEIQDGLKAIAFPSDKGRRGVIYLVPGLDAVEKKLILAEEFCHIYAHHISQVGASKTLIAKTESQAKRMSAYLLMPERFLKNVYAAAVDQAVMVSEIADYFVVSEEFALYRLEIIYNRRVDGFGMLKGKLGSLEWFD